MIRACRGTGFAMFAFQPAAFLGDERRWHEGYRHTSSDDMWAQIEKGAGTRLPYRALQVGDERCNRAAYGCYVGEDWFPLLDDQDPADLHARDVYFAYLGGMNFAGRSVPLLAAKLVRATVAHPQLVAVIGRWALRKARRVGLRRLLRNRRIRPVAFTMHSFMDAAGVAPAWAGMQRGQTSDDPRIAATQQRLQACFYTMAHPETGELAPARVQHSVLDPAETAALRRVLPMPTRRAGA